MLYSTSNANVWNVSKAAASGSAGRLAKIQSVNTTCRAAGHGRTRRHSDRPEIGRAIGNLMAALRNRVAAEGWNEQLLEEVTDILDEAAQRIERAKTSRSSSSDDDDE